MLLWWEEGSQRKGKDPHPLPLLSDALFLDYHVSYSTVQSSGGLNSVKIKAEPSMNGMNHGWITSWGIETYRLNSVLIGHNRILPQWINAIGDSMLSTHWIHMLLPVTLCRSLESLMYEKKSFFIIPISTSDAIFPRKVKRSQCPDLIALESHLMFELNMNH